MTSTPSVEISRKAMKKNKTANTKKLQEPMEMGIFFAGSKLMWRTNESLIIRIYHDDDNFFQVMIGNSETDEEYTPIYLQKDLIPLDESLLRKKTRASQEQNWQKGESEARKDILREVYGNYIVSRLNFTGRDPETNSRDVKMMKSGLDAEEFEKIFLEGPPEHVIPPSKIQKPKRRTFEDFLNAQNALKESQKDLRSTSAKASKEQRAMQMSIDMLDALKYSSKNATGLRKLKIVTLRSIFQEQVELYKQRLDQSPVYQEMLKEQEELREREEHLSNLPSSIPSLPPISPRSLPPVSPRSTQGVLISPRA